MKQSQITKKMKHHQKKFVDYVIKSDLEGINLFDYYDNPDMDEFMDGENYKIGGFRIHLEKSLNDGNVKELVNDIRITIKNKLTERLNYKLNELDEYTWKILNKR
jgi:phenylalanyl-tRNA synthetase beta subunit